MLELALLQAVVLASGALETTMVAEDSGEGPGSPEPYGIKLLLSAKLGIALGFLDSTIGTEPGGVGAGACDAVGYTVM